MYKEEDCLMCYRYKKNKDGTKTPEKVFVAPNFVLLMLLEKLGLELTDDKQKGLVLRKAQ